VFELSRMRLPKEVALTVALPVKVTVPKSNLGPATLTVAPLVTVLAPLFQPAPGDEGNCTRIHVDNWLEVAVYLCNISHFKSP
jgi:hypothetical protein